MECSALDESGDEWFMSGDHAGFAEHIGAVTALSFVSRSRTSQGSSADLH